MDELKEMLKRHEGFRDTIYLDSMGNPTVGYGHHLATGSRITRIVAEELLNSDITDATNDFLKLSLDRINKLNTWRRRVIINMIFNMGLPKVLGFKKMWAAIENEDYETAHDEMLDSDWAEQVGDRAVELAEIMKAGSIEHGA